MASKVTKATLSVLVQEDITLNGQKTSRRNQHDIVSINEVDTRILTVPTHSVNILNLSSSAAAGTYVTSKVAYIRITNLDTQYPAILTFISGTSSAANTMNFKLDNLRSMIFTNSKISGSATNASFKTFSDFTALKAYGSGSAVDVELFVASR